MIFVLWSCWRLMLHVMSPRYWGEKEMNLNSLWAFDIHDLLGSVVCLEAGFNEFSELRLN
jgi:hypothetical protein